MSEADKPSPAESPILLGYNPLQALHVALKMDGIDANGQANRSGEYP
jgi:hypothetical protein